MIEREEACLRSGGDRNGWWKCQYWRLEEHLLTDVEVAFRETYKHKSPSGLG